MYNWSAFVSGTKTGMWRRLPDSELGTINGLALAHMRLSNPICDLINQVVNQHHSSWREREEQKEVKSRKW